MGFALDETDSAISGLSDGKAQFEPAISGAQGDAADISGQFCGQLALRASVGMNSHKGFLLRRLYRRSEKGSVASAG